MMIALLPECRAGALACSKTAKGGGSTLFSPRQRPWPGRAVMGATLFYIPPIKKLAFF
jgi:hypothetical protein